MNYLNVKKSKLRGKCCSLAQQEGGQSVNLSAPIGEDYLCHSEYLLLCHSELVSESITKQTLKRVQGDKFPRPLWERVRESGRFGFTLAEALITIGIIGVVSALTIPNLIINYQKISTVNKLKRNYAMFNQAIKLSIEDNGDLDSWDYSLTSDEIAEKYFIPYLRGMQKMSRRKDNIRVKSLTGVNAIMYDHAINFEYSLLDGSNVVLYPSEYWAYPALTIGVDLNGITPPNQIGKDVFFYAISRNTPRIFAMYQPCMTQSEDHWKSYNIACGIKSIKRNCDANETGNDGGIYAGNSCGALIMSKGWQIDKDYPWKSWK